MGDLAFLIPCSNVYGTTTVSSEDSHQLTKQYEMACEVAVLTLLHRDAEPRPLTPLYTQERRHEVCTYCGMTILPSFRDDQLPGFPMASS